MIRFLCLLFICAVAFGEEQAPVKVDEPKKVVMNEHETAFRALLHGARLEGSFTMKGKHTIDGTAKESYEISSLDKMPNGLWRFVVRIKYMNTDVNVPLFLKVEWSQDTPMIYVENIPVPGVGTYSARVLFHDGRYAGTWAGDGYGGHLFGDVKKPKTKKGPVEEKMKDVD